MHMKLNSPPTFCIVNTKMTENRIGLVFAGGGAKGAYQVGVWKALRCFGIEPYIKGVSGTSVGAFNACLFATGNLDAGYRLWETVTKKDILFFNSQQLYDLAKKIRNELPNLLSTTRRGTPLFLREQIGVFSRERTQQMIKDALSDPVLEESTIDCYATCYCCEDKRAQSFKLNHLDKRKATKILTATSAIPLVFREEELEGKHYYDGGMDDNVPVRPLYEQGIRKFIIVYLAQRDYVDKSQFPSSSFVEIVPSLSLGNFFKGTLNFDKETLQAHINQGYHDAGNLFAPYPDIDQLFEDQKDSKLEDTERKLKKTIKKLANKTIKEIVK